MAIHAGAHAARNLLLQHVARADGTVAGCALDSGSFRVSGMAEEDKIGQLINPHPGNIVREFHGWMAELTTIGLRDTGSFLARRRSVTVEALRAGDGMFSVAEGNGLRADG